jgi:hypothetical protein
MEITDAMRTKRSKNISSLGCVEIDCPGCKGKGTNLVKDTRVIGADLKKHLEDGHHSNCSCRRSTVSHKKTCIRCGGYGTVARSKAA